jgi:hypothetical protein
MVDLLLPALVEKVRVDASRRTVTLKTTSKEVIPYNE